MNYRHILVFFFLVGYLLVPATSLAQATFDEATYRKLLMELIVNLQQQIKLLQLERNQINSTETQDYFNEADLEGFVDVLYSYEIKSPEEVNKIADVAHRKYFAEVFKIFPQKYDELIKELVVFSEDSSDYDAFVQTLPPNHKHWLFAVNEADVSDYSSIENTELVVHELAHIISYDESINSSINNIANCEPYFKNHGCPSASSFLRKYVDEFWSAKDLERADDLVDSEDVFSAVDHYYEKHKDEFVSDYAATSPEEDFSETFMWFVLDKKVSVGTEASEKIDFFNRFSKFLVIKAEINNSI